MDKVSLDKVISRENSFLAGLLMSALSQLLSDENGQRVPPEELVNNYGKKNAHVEVEMKVAGRSVKIEPYLERLEEHFNSLVAEKALELYEERLRTFDENIDELNDQFNSVKRELLKKVVSTLGLSEDVLDDEYGRR